MKKMGYTAARGAYGARLFIEHPVPYELDSALSRLSVWGGKDKTGQNFDSWEFSNFKIGLAMQRASENGYQIHDMEWTKW